MADFIDVWRRRAAGPLGRVAFAALALSAAIAVGCFARGKEPWAGRATLDAALSRTIFDRIITPVACLPQSAGSQVFVGCERIALPQAPSVQGMVDHITVAGPKMTVRGWAADLARGEPAQLVLVASDGTVAVWAPLGKPRDDVAAALGKPAYATAGFEIEIAVPDGFRRRDHDIRLYAVASDGAANELPLGDGAKPQ
jgi:hypothetical protein